MHVFSVPLCNTFAYWIFWLLLMLAAAAAAAAASASDTVNHHHHQHHRNSDLNISAIIIRSLVAVYYFIYLFIHSNESYRKKGSN